MKHLRLFSLLALMTLGLSGCITFPKADSRHVKVIWDNPAAIQNCVHKGTIFGSEGHFYDYWLHSDRDMVWGTLNEMRIKAHELNADTVYLYENFGFLSSVTMMGNAYDCSQVPMMIAPAAAEPATAADSAETEVTGTQAAEAPAK
ncbi:MAG: DUF4156 domain-containing protein [Shewanella sp.]